MQCFFIMFSLLRLFFSCCIVTEVAKENLLKTPAIVPLANFQRVQILRHPRLALDWLCVSFFDNWPIKMSVLLLLCTELTFFCTELPKHCIYLSQSELINFFMYITRLITINWRRFINMFPDFMVYCFYGIVFLLWHCLYLQRLLNRFPCYWGGGGDKQKHEERKQERKNAWFTYTFICFVSCLLSTALVTFKKNRVKKMLWVHLYRLLIRLS